MENIWHWAVHGILLVVIWRLAIDSLTGLWVRRVYQLLYRINLRCGGWIVFLDLDRFKEINDKHGHTQGDRILRDVGRVIRKTVRWRALACRFGGDEFAILTFCKNRQEAENLWVVVLENVRRVTPASGGLSKTEQEADSEMLINKRRNLR